MFRLDSHRVGAIISSSPVLFTLDTYYTAVIISPLMLMDPTFMED